MRLRLDPLPDEAKEAAEIASRGAVADILRQAEQHLGQSDRKSAADYWTLTSWVESLDLGQALPQCLPCTYLLRGHVHVHAHGHGHGHAMLYSLSSTH